MQTFLPYADFSKSAACLDPKRLNKQIVECKQILAALSGESKGYANHPATKQWEGYTECLDYYARCMCHDYFIRNHKKHAMSSVFGLHFRDYNPPWLGYEPYHSMHRAVLLDKDPAWYGQFGWTEQPAKQYLNKGRMSYPYIWPSKMEKFQTKESI